MWFTNKVKLTKNKIQQGTGIKIVMLTKSLKDTSMLPRRSRRESFRSMLSFCFTASFTDSRNLPFSNLFFLSLSRFSSYRNSLHRRLLDGSPRMSTLNATSPNESMTVDGPLSLGSTNGDHSILPIGTSSLVLRKPNSNMFVAVFRFAISF